MRSQWRCLVALLALLTAAAVADAGTITTTFSNQSGTHAGNMFNLQVGPHDITVTALDINVNTLFSTPATLDVFIKTGTFVGSELNSAPWTLVSQNTLTSANPNHTPTHVDVTDFTLNANTLYGVYVTFAGPGAVYPSSGVNPPQEDDALTYSAGANTFSNADLTLTTGNAISGDPFTGTHGNIFSPRTWNGTIYYDVINPAAAIPEPSTFALLALGSSALVGWRRWKGRRQATA